MSILTQTALALNQKLIEYTDINDEIFKKSLRKIIPIPFIFKKIDFGYLESKLNHIILDLNNYELVINELISSKSEDRMKCEIFLKYLNNLTIAVVLLSQISHDLYLKSQNSNTYNYKDHTKLCDKYDVAVKSYVALGDSMNSIFA